MRLSLSFDAWVAGATGSGSLHFEVDIDWYDPYPETSGGLVRSYYADDGTLSLLFSN